ncbi:MAG TPA: tryptophan synthase subunit alpha [Pyrinomonadaceae bacterium]|jgi:tryptophan synthase alpha chain
MKNRIDEKFNRLKSENRGGFIPFIVAGDPNLETTKGLILKLAENGASIVELGIPFSDPVADGVTIQASAERALRGNVNLKEILQIVADVRREKCEVPIILFSYYNPILQFNLENFAAKAKDAGVDGVLITDLVPEEADEFREILARKDLALIMLAAPTSSDERLEKICEKASGFVYAVSRAGVTGARNDLSSDAENLVKRLRKFTNLPIAVGFGISNVEQVAQTWKYADAAVVGSAIVAEIIKLAPNTDEVNENIVGKIGEFAKKLIPNI